MTRTPSQGLKILKELHKKQPNNQWICNNLIHAYIKFGYHDIALDMIADIPNNKADIQSLKLKAWSYYLAGDMDLYIKTWSNIFYKKNSVLTSESINYLRIQVVDNRKIIDFFQEDWFIQFTNAFFSFPQKLREKLGSDIKSVILLANNSNISEKDVANNINDGDLLVLFNRSIFFNIENSFLENPKLFFFRNIKERPLQVFGLPPNQSQSNAENIRFMVEHDDIYFSFGSYYPDNLSVSDSQIFRHSSRTSILHEYNEIFKFYPEVTLPFEASSRVPSSGFMLFKYFYYAQLYLIQTGRPYFKIKLLGFNTTNTGRFWQGHNWEYERKQFESLPSSVTRVII